jgi:hypothetical protein
VLITSPPPQNVQAGVSSYTEYYIQVPLMVIYRSDSGATA